MISQCYSMKLKDVLKGIEIKQVKGNLDKNVSSITNDSRNAANDGLFVAIKGVTVEGHLFIQSAINNGAEIVVYDKKVPEISKAPNDVTFVKVENSRKALAFIAANYYGNYHKKMKVIGITGTNGKTTTSELTYQLLKKLGKKVGLISTVSAKFSGDEIDTGYHVTTPDALNLHRLIHMMYENGCEYLIIETTSHGLDQHRTWGINFEVGAITNITPEHLDYHKTFKNYLDAKARIFRQSKKIILNKYDPSLRKLIKKVPKNLSYEIADYTELNFPVKFKAKFPGQYNLENASIAYNIVLCLTGDDILKNFSNLESVEGRMEKLETGRGFDVIIDFAHDAAALEKVLLVIRKTTKNNLILVFGCAGLRDSRKRSKMGYLAIKLADKTVITAEDPRTEKLEDINIQIESGVIRAGGHKSVDYFVIDDRQKAISFAINKLAENGDTVLITGKGHENSMCFGTTELPWSDRKAVRRALKLNSSYDNRAVS